MAGPSGLEIWLIGTPAELDAAVTALTATGRLIQRGTRHAMAGADAGRYRLYLRLTIAPTTRRPSRAPGASAAGGSLLAPA
ncbi:hypothetical protein [Micromonospora sp. NPDC003241]